MLTSSGCGIRSEAPKWSVGYHDGWTPALQICSTNTLSSQRLPMANMKSISIETHGSLQLPPVAWNHMHVQSTTLQTLRERECDYCSLTLL